MFCPECKAEYRPGFTRCSDCDTDLVDRLPEPGRDSDAVLSDASLREVWTGEDQAECVSICTQLRAAEVPFKVIQRKQQFLKGVEQHLRIGVPPDSYSQAKEIIDKGRLDFTDEAEDQRVMELPGEDGLAAAEKADDDWDPENWHPEDATVEVWFEDTQQHTWMVESSLRENHIHSRTDVLDNGSRRIFVTPDDESRAREIVREVKDGSPRK
jgi:hypothetical protein